MVDQSVRLDKVRRYWEYAGADVDRAQEIYHDDAVLEFPQLGERFEGVTNFTEWRRQYPAEVRYRVRRITARDDLVVVEVSVSYNGGPWQFGVQMLEFRDDKVARERIYIMEGWEAPEWRAPWRADTSADSPESNTYVALGAHCMEGPGRFSVLDEFGKELIPQRKV